MRRVLFAALLVPLFPAAGWSQTGPYTAIINDPEVKLRAGGSDRYPETTLLRKGDTVIVHGEENGWLAVQDPPGIIRSVSWVQTQLIDFNKEKPIPQLVKVEETGALLRAGQMGQAQPSAIQKAKVPPGTILTVIGPGVKFEDRTWYPVAPPAGDYRYVPKSAVTIDKPANMAFTVRDTTPAVRPAGGNVAAASIPGSANTPSYGSARGVNHPLWAQAEAAERDGRYDEAERLYFSLARAMNEPGGDHDVANLCYTRIHALREKRRGQTGGSTSNTRPVAGTPTRSTNDRAAASSSDPRGDASHRTGRGRLVRSQIDLDGRTTYRLEDSRGDAAVYVVPGPGVDLQRYAGKVVEVSGVIHTRQGLSKPYIVATGIEPAQ